MPKYHSTEAAGFDLSASIDKNIIIKPGEIVKISAGLAWEIPSGFATFIYARSGLGTKGLTLANSVGVIDSDYRGEILVALINQSSNEFTIEPGMRIAQAIIMPVVQAEIEEAEELSETARGTGGHGSTGLK